MVLVVAAQRDQCTQAESVREEHLRARVDPHLRLEQFREVWLEIELQAETGAGQRHAADEQNEQHGVGEQGGEVDDLARPADTLEDGQIAQNPRDRQRQRQFPTKTVGRPDPL